MNNKKTKVDKAGTGDMPEIKPRHSLTSHTLLAMGIRISLVIVVVSLLSYWHIVRTMETQIFDKLEKYIQERGEKESAVFLQAQSNHQIFKREFLDIYQQPLHVSAIQFDALFQSMADGTTRMSAELFDGVRQDNGMQSQYASAFIGKNAPLDEQDFRDRLVHAYRLLDRFGPAWSSQFSNVYAVFPENGVVVYWPGLNWGAQADADMDVNTQEWGYVANFINNPQRKTVWTGLYYDQTADKWMVSSETPIDFDGRQLLHVGHDFLLNDLFERVFNDKLEGAYNFIFRSDGRLIAHPDMVDELKQAQGVLQIESIGNVKLSSQYRQVMARSDGNKKTVKVFLDQTSDTYLAVTQINGPDWWFVTAFPKALLSSAARTTAEFIFLLGLASLLIELLMLYLVLRYKVVRPLEKFLGASAAVKSGQYEQVGAGLIRLPEHRNDEVGALARMLREMAKTINQHVAELKHIDKLKDEFMANTSHELRAPLNGIVGLAESMLDGGAGKMTEKQQDNLSLIVTSGQRLIHLVNDILDFSKLRHQTVELQLKPLDIHALVEVVLVLSQPLVKSSDIRLENYIDADGPRVYADENRVQRILYNLVGNAIKYTVQGSISVSSKIEGNNIVVTVCDTGVGIAPDALNKIVEAFAQSSSSSTFEHDGCGLGLTVAKQLVELHQGEIFVKSVVGEGAAFGFSLPIYKDISVFTTISEVTNSKCTDVTLIEPLEGDVTESLAVVEKDSAGHILIVDDEPIDIMVLHNHLSLANYTITTATNGVEALQIIEQSDKFDAVLLDVMMPKMNGFEACEKIRKLYPSNQLPIIILTAKGRVEDMKASFDAGANDVLSKPTSRTELLQRVQTHISVVRLNDDLNVANEQLKQHAKALEQQVLKRTTQLELRGAELEQRSIQLQERTTQLEGVNEQLHDVNEQLRDSAKGVLMLEELGRGLTSTLELNQVIKSIYQSSIKILDADAFMLGIWYSDKNCLNVPLIIEEGLKLPPVDYGLTDVNSPAIWCVKNQKEVLIFEEEDVYNYFELGPAAPKRGKPMQTVVYLPLLLGKQTVGCLSVQNLKENAFSQEQLDRLRMLGSYSAIAIGNATGYAKLQEAHQALKETQKQLVLQEKMASFGTLTAGVAHELNNPTNFVHVGAANLKVDLSKLHTFIMELTEEDADKEIIDSFNIRFESLNQHIQTIVEGTVRIKTIVEDLRSFTHFQTADKKAADINYCVESTINLVKSDPKHKVEFFLDIKPLPKLTSYPARLNQVFLNIMINACDAIAERQVSAEQSFMGKIFVSSQFKDGNLVISISDNGCGMSEQTRVQMFEPFFTTKQVGEGTGLGMAISFGIVEEHGGTIIAKSTKGVGSVVTVLLPLL